MDKHEKINYVEFPAKDIEAAKVFFTSVFSWSFVDYGPEYTACYQVKKVGAGIPQSRRRMLHGNRPDPTPCRHPSLFTEGGKGSD